MYYLQTKTKDYYYGRFAFDSVDLLGINEELLDLIKSNNVTHDNMSSSIVYVNEVRCKDRDEFVDTCTDLFSRLISK